MAEIIQVAGLVTARSEAGTGIKINGGNWLNFTKAEYAKEPFEKGGAVVGARVICQVKDSKWITTIKVLGDEPEHAELQWPPVFHLDGVDEPLAQEAPLASPPREVDYGAPAFEERQRNREIALNAAAWVGVSLAGDAEERGGKILYIAGLFEDWLARD